MYDMIDIFRSNDDDNIFLFLNGFCKNNNNVVIAECINGNQMHRGGDGLTTTTRMICMRNGGGDC